MGSPKTDPIHYDPNSKDFLLGPLSVGNPQVDTWTHWTRLPAYKLLLLACRASINVGP